MLPAENVPPGASEPASELLHQHLLQASPCPDSDQPPVSSTADIHLQLPQTSQLRHAQTGEFLLPVINSGFRNANLSADFPDAGTGFSLFQRKCNLFFGMVGLFHGNKPLCEQEERPDTSSLDWHCFQRGEQRRSSLIINYLSAFVILPT